jgi:hypothetical protein
VKPDFKTIARLPARQSRRIRAGILSVRAVPEARSFRARVAGPRRNSHQSRQQQLPRFRAPLVGEVICRPAPMKISTRRAGASSSIMSLRSEIDRYRSPSTLRASSQPSPWKSCGRALCCPQSTVRRIDRAWVAAEPKDVSDQALMRRLVTAFPIMRPGCFELGEDLLNRIEVGRVFRQEREACANQDIRIGNVQSVKRPFWVSTRPHWAHPPNRPI